MRGGFGIKMAATGGLVLLADRLFVGERWGWTLGLFALAWIAALLLVMPAVRHHRGACLSLLAASAFASLLILDPNWLALALFWVAVTSAAILPRVRFDDALRWTARLAIQVVAGFAKPIRDRRRVARLGRGGGLGPVMRIATIPVVGGAVFAALFAGANPLIGRALASLALPGPGTLILHLVFAAVVTALVWPTLRPVRIRASLPGVEDHAAPVRLPVATLVLSLAVFNIVFATQNALDLVFLWSGAALPDGVTLADYAHRGAYSLIATALLAAGFVLVALHPRSPASGNATVRALLLLWVAQNILLVASSIHRLGDYVSAYSLTELRIAAFAWMGLVAIGLVLVLWRVMAGRSARWLVNANVAAAAVVLSGATAVDFGEAAAGWNVRHSSAAGALDFCYLQSLGTSALVPLAELERAAMPAAQRDQVAALRHRAYGMAAVQRHDGHAWTWRNASRLARADALLGSRPAGGRPGRRECGYLLPTAEPAPLAPQVAPAPRVPTAAPLIPPTLTARVPS